MTCDKTAEDYARLARRFTDDFEKGFASYLLFLNGYSNFFFFTGLLYGSLRTFQAHACDGNELRLNCTRNTIISINFVRYGREAGRGDLCPGRGTYDAETCRLDKALTVSRIFRIELNTWLDFECSTVESVKA